MMKYRKLGHSELNVSELSLGCMSLTGGASKENIEIIRSCFDVGVNYFDTADLYEKGLNETMLGEAVQDFRKDILLASKVGNKWKEDGEGWEWKPSKDHIISSVEQSLKRLRTDYIDLYQLHGGTREDNFDEIMETFELLVKQGKIRYYGISSIRPNVFLNVIKKSQVCSNMMQFSVLDRRPLEYLNDFEKSNVSIIARGGLAQGLLIGKEAKKYLSYEFAEVKELQDKLEDVAKELGLSLFALAQSFVLSHSAVATSVVGVRTAEQLRELVYGIDQVRQLSREEYQSIIEGLKSIAYTEHKH